MNGSTKLWVAPAVILIAVVLAATYASKPSAASPTSEETKLPNGLVARIHFSATQYRSFESVEASYEYYNPTSAPLTFAPATFLKAEAGYEGGYLQGGGVGGMPQPLSVTLEPGETYLNANKYPHIAPTEGRFIVALNGTRGRVEVIPGKLSVKVETGKEEFRVGVGGTCSLVVYNPTNIDQSYGYGVFSQLEFRHGYVGESGVVWDAGGMVVFRDYFSNGKVTLAPGESRVEDSFYFGTPRAGKVVLDVNGVTKMVTVLP